MKSLLVVIDVQNYFVNEETKYLPAKITEHIRRNKYNFVVFTKFVNKKGSNWFKLLNWNKMTSPPETDIHLSLRNFVKDTNVFEKSTYSIFKNQKFLDFLKKNNITKIYLCGLDIDSCVLASAFEAFDLGYEVKVLEDISYSHYGEDFHKSGIKIIEKDIQK